MEEVRMQRGRLQDLIVLTRSLQPLHPDFAIALALAAGTIVAPCPRR